MQQNYAIPSTLESEESLRQVLSTAKHLNEFEEAGSITIFVRALGDRLRTEGTKLSPELIDSYQQVVRYLQFATLSAQSDQTIASLFRKHLLEGLRSDVDLKTELELTFLVRNDDLLERPFRRQILREISQNNEALGNESIAIPGMQESAPAQIQYWVVDYLHTMPTDRQPGALEIAKYLNQSPNVNHLSESDRALLEQVLSLYGFIVAGPLSEFALKVFQAAAAGPVEESSAGAETGAEAKASAALTPIQGRPTDDFRSFLLQGLFEESAMEDAIDVEEQRLLSGGYERSRVVADLKSALSAGNVPTLAAALFVLARSGDLGQLLGHEADLQLYVEQEVFPSILSDLKQQKGNVQLATLIENFRRQPNRIVYLKIFLERALTNTVGGDADASARLGVRLASYLFQQGVTAGATMAFFDEQQARYRWGKVGLDSQGVPIIAE